MLGSSSLQKLHQAAEPFLTVQNLGPIPIGIIVGVIGCILTFLLLDNKTFPAGLVIIFFGVATGLLLGGGKELGRIIFGLNGPNVFPHGFPTKTDFVSALFILAIPQLPMTIGNAVVANADLSKNYFGDDSKRVTPRALCMGMGMANFFSFTVGGMPLCHGAGGLAAHYRFGARTAGSNWFIGLIFIALALFLGMHSLTLLHLLPLAVLGVLLLFAGGQLSVMILDMVKKKDLFVCLMVLGITLASNLAAGFIVSIIFAFVLKSKRFKI
jgi:SulP family sulfate permease